MMSILGEYLAFSYYKVSGKSGISLLCKKTNGVQSHDTPHLPKYMRKLVQSYYIYSNHQIFNSLFSSQWFK